MVIMYMYWLYLKESNHSWSHKKIQPTAFHKLAKVKICSFKWKQSITNFNYKCKGKLNRFSHISKKKRMIKKATQSLLSSAVGLLLTTQWQTSSLFWLSGIFAPISKITKDDSSHPNSRTNSRPTSRPTSASRLPSSQTSQPNSLPSSTSSSRANSRPSSRSSSPSPGGLTDVEVSGMKMYSVCTAIYSIEQWLILLSCFLQIGERVIVAGQKRGVVRFSGRTQFAPG